MTMCSMLSEQTQAGDETLLAIGLSQSEITLLAELAEQHHLRVLVANADCDLSSIPAFAIIANPEQLAKDQFDLLLASQAAAAKVIFTTEPPWQIPAGVKSSAMVDPKLFHKNGALLFRILVRKHLYDQKPVDEKASRLYTLVRRYFHLDREQLLFTVQRDELVQVEAVDLDQAFEQAIGQINTREGTAGIVPDQGRTPGNEPYIGLHADRELELPQLPSMDRMHLDADTFDILFEPEGGKFHGESYSYLHIDGHVFTADNPPDQRWCFAMEDHCLEGAFLPPYEFTGRLLAFCLDRCSTDAGEITRECWLYRTDDGYYLLHAATDADYDSRVVYRNASARAILKRAERFLADGATAQSATFLCHAAQAMGLKTTGKGGAVMTYPNNQQRTTSYLDRQKETQIARKGLHLSLPAQQPGLFMGKRRPFCIHEEYSHENLYAGIREQALDYFRSYGVAWHSDLPGKDKPSNHLCDSQICCLNFLFPLRDDAEAVADLMRTVFPSLRRVLPMEDDGGYIAFEWIGLKNYLNEKTIGGVRKRGEYATSADAAVMLELHDGSRQIVLIEWKYSEAYQALSKRFSRAKTDRSLIYAPYFYAPDGPIDRELVSDFHDLFYDPFDQLMRQQLLAREMEKAKELGASTVSVLHIAPRANHDFAHITSPGLVRLGAGTAVKTWEAVVREQRFISVATEVLFGHISWQRTEKLRQWWEYIDQRYGWFGDC